MERKFIGHLEGLSEEQYKCILKTVQRYFAVELEEIDKWYCRFKQYNQNNDNGNLFYSPNGYHRDGFYEKENIGEAYKEAIAKDAEFFGIDLPYWFNLSSSKIRLMIVGLNPNRNRDEWTKNNPLKDKSNTVLINAGWGANNEFNFDQKYRKLLFKLQDKHCFYLTDYQKIFFWYNKRKKKDKKTNQEIGVYTNSYSYKKLKELDDNKKIFEREIEAMKPTHIISFGTQVAKALLPNSEKITYGEGTTYGSEKLSYLPLLHLSDANGKAWKHFLKDKPHYYGDKADILYKIITDFTQ